MLWVFEVGDEDQNRRLAREIPAAQLPIVAAEVDALAAKSDRELDQMLAAGTGSTNPAEYGVDDSDMDWLGTLAYGATRAGRIVRDEARRRARGLS